MITRSRLVPVLIIMTVMTLACSSSIGVVTVQPPSDPQSVSQPSEIRDPSDQSTGGAALIETKLAQATMLALTPGPTPRPVATWSSEPSLGTIEWKETRSIPNPASAPFDSLRGQQLIFHDGKVYVFGGRNASDERLTTVYFSPIKLNGTLAGWVETTSLPGGYYDHVIVTVGDYIYLLTGAAGSEDVYYAPFNADGSLGVWRKTASLSPSRQTFAAVSYGNFIYAAGGNSGGIQSFVQFTSVKPDGSLSHWRYTTSLPVAVQEHTIVAHDGHLYVLGGKNAKNEWVANVYFSTIQPDGELGDWEKTAPLQGSMSGYAAFEGNGYIYLLGGDSAYYARILEDHALGEWKTVTSLPARRYGLRVGANNGFAYALGGFDSTAHQTTTYYGWLASQMTVENPAGNYTDCTSGWTQLKISREAKVSEGNSLPNRVHLRPGKSEPTVALLYPGSVVNMLEGPICTEGAVFWRVESRPGIGWTAEGEGRKYFLEPVR